MGWFKTDLEKMEEHATRLSFNPTTDIPKTNVQEAIEQAIANAALSSNDFLVKTASSNLTAERVVTDTDSIAWDWGTSGQAKAVWQGLVTDTSPQLGGDLDLNGNDITGTGDIDITGTGSFSGQLTQNGGDAVLDDADIGDSVQAYAANLDEWATVDPSSNGKSLVAAADYAAMRALLDLEAGTDFYSLSDLASTANGKGSALIGIEDAGSYFSGTTVESALQYLGGAVAALDQAVVLKGTWSAAGGTFPGSGSAQAGWSYIVSADGTVDGVEFKEGDRILAIVDNASTSTYANNWIKLDYTDRVSSVAGRVGAVTLASTDITDWQEAVEDTVGALLTGSEGTGDLDWTYTDGSGTLNAAVKSNAITTAKLLDNNVTLAKVAQGTALSVLGVAGNSTANYADIAAGSDKQVMRRNGTSIGFGAVELDQTNAVTGQLRSGCVPALTGAVSSAGGTLSTTATIALQFIIGDGTNTITTGVKGFFYCPFAFTIVEWTLVGDASGSIVVDIWSDVYANGRPTVADTITASAKPTLSSANTNQSSSLTGWTTAVPAGNFLGFNVDSITTCKQVTLTLKVTKTS